MAPLKTKRKDKPFYHVAVGAIVREDGSVLIAKRAAHKLQGDRWEFPGGKCEPEEDPRSGLARELEEEIGVQPIKMRPLIKIPYDYSEFDVLLDVYRIEAYAGQVQAREKQELKWVPANKLDAYQFPDANIPILRAIQLPTIYKFTYDPASNGLIRLHKQAFNSTHTNTKNMLLDLLFYNDKLPVAGLHLTSRELYQFETRPIPSTKLLAASLHTLEDIRQANKLRCDLAVLSPVKHTTSHPEAEPIGWESFEQLIETAHFPVYALGGMTPDDLETAWAHGAQGIAGIRFV